MARYTEIDCPACGRTFRRTYKQLNQVIKRSGAWTCKGCSTTKRNKLWARSIGETRVVKCKGYIEVKTEDGWRRLNRVVAEESIGRPLHSSEVAHHINGDKQDNRPENIMVLNHGEHTRLHHTGLKRSGQTCINIREGQRRAKNEQRR